MGKDLTIRQNGIHEELFRIMELFCILIVVVVTQVCTFVKILQIAHLKWVQ